MILIKLILAYYVFVCPSLVAICYYRILTVGLNEKPETGTINRYLCVTEELDAFGVIADSCRVK